MEQTKKKGGQERETNSSFLFSLPLLFFVSSLVSSLCFSLSFLYFVCLSFLPSFFPFLLFLLFSSQWKGKARNLTSLVYPCHKNMKSSLLSQSNWWGKFYIWKKLSLKRSKREVGRISGRCCFAFSFIMQFSRRNAEHPFLPMMKMAGSNQSVYSLQL